MVIMVYCTLQMHLQQPPILETYIYNHTRMAALYMYVYVHYGMCVYIHRYTCYGFIYVLLVYKCFHISLYIWCIFSVYVCVCVRVSVCGWVCKAWVWIFLPSPFKQTFYPPLPPSTCSYCPQLCNLSFFPRIHLESDRWKSFLFQDINQSRLRHLQFTVSVNEARDFAKCVHGQRYWPLLHFLNEQLWDKTQFKCEAQTT